jgi:hypothetical protein
MNRKQQPIAHKKTPGPGGKGLFQRIRAPSKRATGLSCHERADDVIIIPIQGDSISIVSWQKKTKSERTVCRANLSAI